MPRGPHELDMSRNPWYARELSAPNMADSFVGRTNPVELTDIVDNGLTLLRDKNKNVQNRGVKILSALAQTGRHILRHPVCNC